MKNTCFVIARHSEHSVRTRLWRIEMSEEPIRSESVEAFNAFFQQMREKDISAWAQLWHPDARIVVEYPPAGFPSGDQWKDEIVSGFRDLFAHFSSYDATIRT
jgi:hypothetical protein